LRRQLELGQRLSSRLIYTLEVWHQLRKKNCYHQWRRGRERQPPPLNFNLSKKFSSKNANFCAENPPFMGNLGAKLTFWAPMIFSVKNLQLFVEKLRLPVPTFSSTNDTLMQSFCLAPYHHHHHHRHFHQGATSEVTSRKLELQEFFHLALTALAHKVLGLKLSCASDCRPSLKTSVSKIFIGPSSLLVQFLVCFKSFTGKKYWKVCIATVGYLYFSYHGYYSVCQFYLLWVVNLLLSAEYGNRWTAALSLMDFCMYMYLGTWQLLQAYWISGS